MDKRVSFLVNHFKVSFIVSYVSSSVYFILFYSYKKVRHAVAQLLRQYATSQKVAFFRPDEVISFNLPNPSGRTRPWGSISL
jgi:hypothetical protein